MNLTQNDRLKQVAFDTLIVGGDVDCQQQNGVKASSNEFLNIW